MASHRASNNSMVSSLETQTAIIDQVLREGVSPPDREPELQKNKKKKIAKSGSSGAKTSDVTSKARGDVTRQAGSSGMQGAEPRGRVLQDPCH